MMSFSPKIKSIHGHFNDCITPSLLLDVTKCYLPARVSYYRSLTRYSWMLPGGLLAVLAIRPSSLFWEICVAFPTAGQWEAVYVTMHYGPLERLASNYAIKTHAYTSKYIQIHACMHVHQTTCIYIKIHACMYIKIHAHTSKHTYS